MAKPSILLNQFAGWRAAVLDHVELSNAMGTLQLRRLPGAATPLTDAAGTLGGLINPSGLAIDSCERIYILDTVDNCVKRFDPCLHAFEKLPCLGGRGNAPRQLNAPGGIAVSGRDDLFIADTGNARVQVFSIKGLALRRILGPVKIDRDAHAWSPRDVAVSCASWLFVADYANGLIHVFDPYLCWRKAFDGSSANQPALQKPVRIAIDDECRIYVVQDGASYVACLNADGERLDDISVPASIKGRFCPVAVAVDKQGALHVADPYALYQFESTGTSHCCVSRAATETPAISDLLFDNQGNPIVAAGSQVAQLTADFIYEPAGTFVSDALDSRIYRCPWHRVAIHGALAAGTQATVETLTAEETKTVAELVSLPDQRWTPSATNTTVASGDWDCLVHSPPGRYLWVRLRFASDGRASPCIDGIRLEYPRASSLQYLPAAYSQDEPSRQFLDQFLSIFDTLWAGVGNRIGQIAAYFDPMATPASARTAGADDFLSWLAGWLGMTVDRHWPERRRRLLVRNAWKLYKLRGTPAGLSLHIELYTGIKPQILEHYKLRRWLWAGYGKLGDQSALWGASIVDRLQLNIHSQLGGAQLIGSGDPLLDPFLKEAYQFTVFVPQCGPKSSDPQASALQKQTLERIIEMAKPAHTMANLQFTKPRFRIGIQSFIGKDTVVGAYPTETIEGQSKLGYESVLSAPLDERGSPSMRIGKTARIGAGTLVS